MKVLTLLFLMQEDEVLLAMKKRGFGAGRWNGVGGKIDPGETVVQAMVREAEEEIFITPLDYEAVAQITFHETFNGEASSMLVHVFTCTKWVGEPKESEEMAPQWYGRENLPFDEMWPDDPYWLPQVLAGHKLTAEFTLDSNDTIISKHVELK